MPYSSLRSLPALLLLLLAFAAPARAATLTVTTTADAGSGSLRAQVASAAAGDTVTFASGVGGTITLTSGALPTISQRLTIMGPGASTLAVDGNHASRVFRHHGRDRRDLRADDPERAGSEQ